MRIVVCIAALQLAASIALSSAGSFADSLDQRSPRSEYDAKMVGRWERALARDPTRLSSYHGLALALRGLDREDDAIAVLQRALWLNPIDASTNRELGMCFYSKEKYAQSIPFLRRSVWYAPTDFSSWRCLGDSLYESKRYEEAAAVFETALLTNPKSFDAAYWNGLSLNFLQRYDEAAKSLAKAVQLEPEDFEANYWCGSALLHAGKFREASARLEKAHALKPSSNLPKPLLCAAYAGSGEYAKAFRIYPRIMGFIGAIFVAIYLVGLAGLCWFSFRIGRAAFPPLTLSLLWLAFMFEGQIAFIFLLGLLPSSGGAGNALLSVMLPALPVLIAAIFGFKRQPWGAPFQWPLRFGGMKTVGLAVLLLLFSFALNVVTEKFLLGAHRPTQKAIVFLREAMNRNPVLAFVSIGLVVPMAEEILFRGMIFSSLQKWWRTGWVIFATAILFALVHLDFIFFFPLFFLGLVLGWARWRSRSLGLSIFIHAANNSIAVLAMMFVTAS